MAFFILEPSLWKFKVYMTATLIKK